MHKGLNSGLILIVISLTLLATWYIDGRARVSTIDRPTSPPRPQSADIDTDLIAPDIALTALDGSTTRLYDYKGKIVLLNFWATWCTPCIAEFAQFQRLAEALPEDLIILAVSVDEQPSALAPFLRRYLPELDNTPNLLIFHDAGQKLSQDIFQTVRVPETVIINPQMKMTRKIAGLSFTWDSQETIAYLSALKKD